ncbi:MAG TPA: apolipoprotein N-acyltransferase [Hyphomicrobiaceae bacterium]|nr:apolipoprotein N-acyltransferase [Hyphomicrobiaceae bacterium]
MPAEWSIAGLAARVRNLRGWRRRAAAFATGALSVLAMAPFFAWPVLWITLPALVWLIEGATSPRGRASSPPGWEAAPVASPTPQAGVNRQPWHARPAVAAAEIGWWFGFGYFVPGLFWIGEAFLIEAETFAFLLPFAVTLLPAYLALYWAAAAGVAARLAEPGPRRVVVLALALSAGEWLRGHLLSGFPWNTLGYALTFPLTLMQSAAVLGIYGLTLLTILVFALPPVLWPEAPSGIAGRRARIAALALALGPIAGMALLGGARLALATDVDVPGVKLRIVQPSVPQREKWRPENQRTIFLDHLTLLATSPDGHIDNAAGITHVIWPEAAMPFLPLDHPEALSAIGRSLPAGSVLVTGALRAEPAPPGAPHPRQVFNSILVLGEGGTPAGVYDKIHLVPFGEYLPLQRTLEAIGLQQLSRLRGGFAAGMRPRPLLRVPLLPAAAPLVCYEAIFPAAIVQGSERPGLMLNVTNDGWFGDTTGPRQHLHQARVRAVEEGLPLVRAANNGISAAIDSYGRIRARLDLNQRGTLDAALPAAVPPPVYARLGDLVFVGLWLALAAALLLHHGAGRSAK